jgi:hypothetical protein
MYATAPRARCRRAFASTGHHSVLELFAGEHRRVLRPGGYTARTIAAPSAAMARLVVTTCSMTEGSSCTLSTKAPVDRLAAGCELITTQPRVIRTSRRT